MTKVHRTFVLASAISAMLSPQRANAYLNIDLRATGINGGLLPPGDTPRSVFVKRNDVVSFDVFAVIRGANTTTADDKLLSVSGSFTSFGLQMGDLKLGLVPTTFDPITGQVTTTGWDGQGSSIGTQQDLDDDGDLDVGGNVDSDDTGFWTARHHLWPNGSQNAGSFNPTTGGRRIGFGTFTVTAEAGLSPTSITFDGRSSPDAAQYYQDGQLIHEASFFSTGFEVHALDPEPVSLPIAMGAIAMLATRARGRGDRAGRDRYARDAS